MDYVPPSHNSVVSSDRPGLSSQRVCSTDQLPSRGDYACSLPDHCDNGPRADVGNQIPEEGLRREILVVLLCERARRGEEFQGGELEALALEAADDLSDEAALDSVGLDLLNVGWKIWEFVWEQPARGSE